MAEKQWRSNLERYPEHVQKIGMISIECANLETALADLFSATFGIAAKIGHAIYLTPKSAIARLEIFREAANVAFAPEKDEIDPHRLGHLSKTLEKIRGILERARSAIGKRHGIIHDAWGAPLGGEEAIRYKIAGAYTDEGTPVKITELQSILDQIRDLIGEVISLTFQFKKEPPLSSYDKDQIQTQDHPPGL